jgi:hypothetical protein
MNRRYNIQNLEELQAQLFMLKTGSKVKEQLLKENLKLYVKQYTFGNLMKKYVTPSNLLKVDDKMHISSKLMSFVLPVLMNSTFFRGSGFMTKALVGLATSKMGKSLDAEHLTSLFATVKGWFKKDKKDTQPKMHVDYGIPPDSETF